MNKNIWKVKMHGNKGGMLEQWETMRDDEFEEFGREQEKPFDLLQEDGDVEEDDAETHYKIFY
jgi:hypothetical protein